MSDIQLIYRGNSVTPAKYKISNRGGFISLLVDFDSNVSDTEYRDMIFIPGTTEVPVYNGNEFEVVKASGSIFRKHGSTNGVWYPTLDEDDPHERVMQYPFPIDPRANREDWEGAVDVYLNDEGTAWLPKHTTAGAHKDYELNLKGDLNGLIDPLLRLYQLDDFEATTTEAHERAQKRFCLAAKLYGKALLEVEKIARAYHLGERHQEPHPEVGYVHDDLTKAIAQAKAVIVKDMTADEKKQYDKDTSEIYRYVENQLNIPDPETRWDRVARLAAEAKKAQAAGT